MIQAVTNVRKMVSIEVGLVSPEHLDWSMHHSKGFAVPILSATGFQQIRIDEGTGKSWFTLVLSLGIRAFAGSRARPNNL